MNTKVGDKFQFIHGDGSIYKLINGKIYTVIEANDRYVHVWREDGMKSTWPREYFDKGKEGFWAKRNQFKRNLPEWF